MPAMSASRFSVWWASSWRVARRRAPSVAGDGSSRRREATSASRRAMARSTPALAAEAAAAAVESGKRRGERGTLGVRAVRASVRALVREETDELVQLVGGIGGHLRKSGDTKRAGDAAVRYRRVRRKARVGNAAATPRRRREMWRRPTLFRPRGPAHLDSGRRPVTRGRESHFGIKTLVYASSS